MKLLEENIGEALYDLGLGIEFWQKKHNPWKKVIKLDLIKIENFCSAKDPVKKKKRQVIEWEEIFANIPHKGLISGIYEDVL